MALAPLGGVFADEVSVFAHQGGWDEFLLVAAPLGVIGLLLWIANKRVTAKLEEANATQGTSDPADEPANDQTERP